MKKKIFNCLINSFLFFLCFCKFIFAQENSAAIFVYHRFGENNFPTTNIQISQFKAHLNELEKKVTTLDCLKADEALIMLKNKIGMRNINKTKDKL